MPFNKMQGWNAHTCYAQCKTRYTWMALQVLCHRGVCYQSYLYHLFTLFLDFYFILLLLINVNNNIDKNIRKSVLKTQINGKASQTFGLIYVNIHSTKLVDITCSSWQQVNIFNNKKITCNKPKAGKVSYEMSFQR